MNFVTGSEIPEDASATTDNEPVMEEGDLSGDGMPAVKKKPNQSAMLLFGLIIVAAGVIWFMYLKPGPQAAQAVVAPGSDGSEIKQFLDSGNIDQMKRTLGDTEKLVQQFRAYPGKTQVPLSSLRTNPFRELAPRAEAAARVDDDEARNHARIVTAISELHLQSVVRGGKYRACMINNTLYQKGQQVGIFMVEEVSANAVVLSSGKYRFELTMQN
jgi:hypothetical protein